MCCVGGFIGIHYHTMSPTSFLFVENVDLTSAVNVYSTRKMQVVYETKGEVGCSIEKATTDIGT